MWFFSLRFLSNWQKVLRKQIFFEVIKKKLELKKKFIKIDESIKTFLKADCNN